MPRSTLRITNAAIALEARIVSPIGRGTVPSQYRTLHISSTGEPPIGADTIHVNAVPEDLLFPAAGTRVLINGHTTRFPTDFFSHIEAHNLPPTGALPLIPEIYRVQAPGGKFRVSPSYDILGFQSALFQAG